MPHSRCCKGGGIRALRDRPPLPAAAPAPIGAPSQASPAEGRAQGLGPIRGGGDGRTSLSSHPPYLLARRPRSAAAMTQPLAARVRRGRGEGEGGEGREEGGKTGKGGDKKRPRRERGGEGGGEGREGGEEGPGGRGGEGRGSGREEEGGEGLSGGRGRPKPRPPAPATLQTSGCLGAGEAGWGIAEGRG